LDEEESQERLFKFQKSIVLPIEEQVLAEATMDFLVALVIHH
jgi:hypothetical protein